MDIAIHLANFDLPGGPAQLAPTLAATARAADEGGFATLTLMDHWFQMEQLGDGAVDPMLDGYTTLGFLAGQTSRIQLGLLAKIVTTLDVLSGGRAVLGIGAAWYEREHRGLGVPFPPVAERFERLEETLRIAEQMWGDDDGAFDGVHYRLAETLGEPKPTSRPHPPIMIGGRGEKKTLRLAAQYAQIVNLTASDPADVKHLLEVLEAHCDRLGTDYAVIEKTVIAARDPFAGDFIPAMAELAELGVTMVVLRVNPPDPVGSVTRLADEVLPALAQL